ncbi:MAG: glycosyl transferase, UDP-glucuronosyltransferase [Acidobacteria bacterium]|nr:glycosyl transferase, UDP-glucuronosyltransferase [Acidobacteriota bacterium]
MTTGKRIILTTFGSYGDIHPYMGLAIELQARGHHPIIATSELYREKMQLAGFDFVPLRPNIPPPQEQDAVTMERVMNPKSGSGFLLNEMLFPFVRDGYEDLLQAVQGADLLLTHPITFAGPLVAQKTGIPWVSSVLAPVSFFSAYDPPVPPFWAWMRHAELLGPRFVAAFFKQVKKVYNNKAYNEFRNELGLPDRGSPVFEGQHSPTLILAMFSKLFAQSQPDWPPQARVTGFAFYDGRNELEMPPELSRFLDDGPPPIVFTLGSSAVWVARDFYRESIAAANLLERRAVLLIGDERNRPGEALPATVMAVNYAPFEALLPRACAMVHHGGVGTTSQGLRAGVPTLIVPFAFDQPDNAAHAARVGTSRTLPRGKYHAARIARELSVLLTEPSYAQNARDVGRQLRAENGAAVACDFIEAVLSDSATRADSRGELLYAAGH